MTGDVLCFALSRLQEEIARHQQLTDSMRGVDDDDDDANDSSLERDTIDEQTAATAFNQVRIRSIR